MRLSLHPSERAQQTAAYLMETFVEAAAGDMERAGELAQLYIDGMTKNNDMNIRETAQCLKVLATEPQPPKYLT